MLKTIEGGLSKRKGRSWVVESHNRELFKTIPFQMEVCLPDGTRMHYQVEARNLDDAREEAKQLVHDMAEAYMDKRIAWRMTGDRNWSFCSARIAQKSKSITERIKDYFFPYEEA